jgi:A/G-specific adenine glycosylase
MEQLTRALIAWYRRARRTLPWREEPTPYRVWVAEIMAQQTRLETVQPYFERFLARFPTPAALATAPLDEVLALWSGLGYYRRARLLHQAARLVVARHAGELPSRPEALRALPGVGRYTAGAIASVAFGLPEPVLDGNVKRVLSRLLDLPLAVDSAAGERRLWAEAEALVRSSDDPSALNQGLMELGALVCMPSTPACPACPLRDACRALRAGSVARRPVRAPRREPRIQPMATLVVRRADGAVLLRKNPPEGLFGGLWSVPLLACAASESGARRAAEELVRSLGPGLGVVELSPGRPPRLEHVLTHRLLRLWVFQAVAQGSRAPKGCRWVDGPARLGQLGVAELTRKVLAVAGGTKKEGARSKRSPSRSG